jgi:hypothetical protein
MIYLTLLRLIFYILFRKLRNFDAELILFSITRFFHFVVYLYYRRKLHGQEIDLRGISEDEYLIEKNSVYIMIEDSKYIFPCIYIYDKKYTFSYKLIYLKKDRYFVIS